MPVNIFMGNKKRYIMELNRLRIAAQINALKNIINVKKQKRLLYISKQQENIDKIVKNVTKAVTIDKYAVRS